MTARIRSTGYPVKMSPRLALTLLVALLILHPCQAWALRLSLTCSSTAIAPLAPPLDQQSMHPLAIDLDFDGRVDSLSITHTSEGDYFSLVLASGSIYPLTECNRGACPMNSPGGIRTPRLRYLITTTDHEGGEDASLERYRLYRHDGSRLLLVATFSARHPPSENATRFIFVPNSDGSIIAIYGQSAVWLRFDDGQCDMRSIGLANVWRRFAPQWASEASLQDCPAVLARAHRLRSLVAERLSRFGPLLPAGTHVILRGDVEFAPSAQVPVYYGSVATEGLVQEGFIDLESSEVPPRCRRPSRVSP